MPLWEIVFSLSKIDIHAALSDRWIPAHPFGSISLCCKTWRLTNSTWVISQNCFPSGVLDVPNSWFTSYTTLHCIRAVTQHVLCFSLSTHKHSALPFAVKVFLERLKGCVLNLCKNRSKENTAHPQPGWWNWMMQSMPFCQVTLKIYSDYLFVQFCLVKALVKRKL